jgi:hypothetical protein
VRFGGDSLQYSIFMRQFRQYNNIAGKCIDTWGSVGRLWGRTSPGAGCSLANAASALNLASWLSAMKTPKTGWKTSQLG